MHFLLFFTLKIVIFYLDKYKDNSRIRIHIFAFISFFLQCLFLLQNLRKITFQGIENIIKTRSIIFATFYNQSINQCNF